MTISATNQGLRPGVCTSTSRPSTPFDGMMIYETDTNLVLVWDNAAWVMIADTDSPPGLQLIKNEAVGSGLSTLTINNIFSSEFDAYKIVFSNIDGTASTGYLRLQLVDSGGTAATTNYSSSGIYLTYASTTVNGINETEWRTALGDQNFGGSVEIFNPFLSVATYAMSMVADNSFYRSYAWKHSTASSYTGLKFDPSWGTISGGNIRVYGFRNS